MITCQEMMCVVVVGRLGRGRRCVCGSRRTCSGGQVRQEEVVCVSVIDRVIVVDRIIREKREVVWV